MKAVLYVLLGWWFTIGACMGLGTWMVRWLKLEIDGWELWLYRFLVGAAGLSGLVFALCSLRVAYRGVHWAVGAALILSAWRSWQRPRMEWRWTLSMIPAAVYAVFYLLHAMAPEMSPDGMSYHLGLVNRYAREHGFVWFSTNMYGYLSQGLEMLFLFAFLIGKHSAAALVHYTFLLVLPALMTLHAGRMGFLAGSFVLLMPVVGIDGVSAYNDVALATVGFAVFHAMERWRRTGAAAWVSVAALLAGFGFSIKYTGVALGLLLLPSWRLWPRWSLALLLSAPWLVKNLAWSGNPVAPFFNAWFPNPWFSQEFEAGYQAYFRTYELPNVLAYLKELFVGGAKLSGTLGPLAGLLPAAVLGVRHARRRRLVLAAGAMLLLYPLNIGTRFLIPALPFLALAMFLTLPRLSYPLLCVAAILHWPSVARIWSPEETWRLRGAPWKASLRLESEDGYLTRKSAAYITARMIDQFVPANETVYSHSPIPESYCNRNIIVAYQGTLGLKMQHALFAGTYEPYQPVFRYRCAARELVIAKAATDTWSITEIEPRPERVECSRMPWDARLANDGNWLSRWRSWGPVRAGDRCSLSGSGPVTVWGTGDQWGIEIANCVREVAKPPIDARAEARRYLLSMGVKYLAVDVPDYNYRDMIDHAAEWGVELVAERNGMRLYRFRESP
jgi:hypothetical protein